MEGTKIICRLCLNFTNCDESQVLDNVSKDMLQFILPQVNLNITHDPKICQACYKSVLSCYRFKSNCNKDVNSEAKKDSSSRESETISIQDEELEKKCNFCSSSRVDESSEEFNDRKTYFVEVLQKCLPEWNLSTKTVPCKKCLDILTSQFTFIGNCADTEDKLKHYCLTQGTNSEGKLNLYEAVRHILSKENKNVASTGNELVFCDESVENVNIAENDSLREANDDVPFPEVEVNTRVLKTEEVDIKPEALDEEYMESERLDEPGGSGSVTSQMPNTDVDGDMLHPPRKRSKKEHFDVEVKDAASNVYNIKIREHPQKLLKDIGEKVTSISSSSVQKTNKEYEMVGSSSGLKPNKSRISTTNLLNSSQKAAIRRKFYNFFFRKEIPTIPKLLKAVNDDLALPNLKSYSFISVLKKLKLKFQKHKRNSLLLDRDEVRCWRREYLTAIKRYRNEGRKIYYVSETWTNVQVGRQAFSEGSFGLKSASGAVKRLVICHIGNEDGFLPVGMLTFESKKSGDKYQRMDAPSFEKWFFGILPKLEPNSVIVLDNSPCHSRKIEKVPTAASRKCEVRDWLRSKNIPFDDSKLKAQLLRLVEDHKERYNKYVVDEMAKAQNKVVLRLPPYHDDLNPMELIWAEVKYYAADKNTTGKLTDVKNVFEEALLHITLNKWKNCVQHVQRKIEVKMWQIDDLMDAAMEPIGNHFDNDSSMSSDMDTE